MHFKCCSPNEFCGYLVLKIFVITIKGSIEILELRDQKNFFCYVSSLKSKIKQLQITRETNTFAKFSFYAKENN